MAQKYLLALVAVAACVAAAAAAASNADVGEDVAAEVPTMQLGECATQFMSGEFDVACMRLVLVKAVGFAIIAGAFGLKLPQILNIVKAGTSDGISPTAMYIETFGYASSAVYNILLGSPLSAYGEYFVILVQNAVIIVMVWNSTKASFGTRALVATLLLGSIGAEFFVPKPYQYILNLLTVPIFSMARLPQIYENFSNGHTGVLAFATVFLSFAGSLARVGTSLAEVDDPWVAGNFLIGALWNGILLLQIVWYWNATAKYLADEAAKKKE